MNDYVGYDYVNMYEFSQDIVMRNQLALEGVYIEIETRPTKAIIRNQVNPLSEDREDRVLITDINTPIKRGDYIKYNNEDYITLADIDNHVFYKKTKIRKCNQRLKWIDRDGIVREYPCLIVNDSYGVKENLSNDYINENMAKAKIIMQNNKDTVLIPPNFRFIFNNSKHDIYKTIDISTAINNGLITIMTAKDLPVFEDDIENNLAYNSGVFEEVVYDIIGENQIRYNQEYIYTLTPSINDNVEFVIDDEEIATIVKQSNGSCTIKGIKKNELFKLSVRLNDKILNSKTIFVGR